MSEPDPLTVDLAYYSHLKTFTRWIGKPKLLKPISAYFDDPALYTRSYCASEDKSWRAMGVDVFTVIRDVEAYDVHAAACLWLMVAFGLRFKESLMLRPHADVATPAQAAKAGASADQPAMRKTVHLQLNVPIDERARLLREDYAHLADNPMAMVERLLPLKALVGGEELALWQSLAEDGQVDELCRRVLQYHYDPSYRRSRQRSHGESGTIIELPAMDPQSLASAAADLTLRFGGCNPR